MTAVAVSKILADMNNLIVPYFIYIENTLGKNDIMSLTFLDDNQLVRQGWYLNLVNIEHSVRIKKNCFILLKIWPIWKAVVHPKQRHIEYSTNDGNYTISKTLLYLEREHFKSRT